MGFINGWPKEPSDLDVFYGNPRGAGGANPAWERTNLTTIRCPWQMRDEGKPVAAITVHRKCAGSLTRVLDAIWNAYGRDQDRIDAVHLSEFGGSYNYRVNRNNASRLSVHAYGAAIDIAPDKNPNGKAWKPNAGMMPQVAIDAFRAEGWAWGGDFSGTPDAMHFQATFDRHHAASEVIPSAFTPSQRCTGIVATVFGGAADPQRSAYDGHVITDTELGCALPFRFTGPRYKVRAWNSEDGTKTAILPIVDVGPWNTDDDYWTMAAGPQAESGTDKSGRRTNKAGIDLTPAAARALGIRGMGKVDWQFVLPAGALKPTPTPPAVQPHQLGIVGAFLAFLAGAAAYGSSHPAIVYGLAGLAAVAGVVALWMRSRRTKA